MGSECPSCGREAAPQARFCTACGRPVDATSAPLIPGFLPETGYLPGPPPAPAEQRRGGGWGRAVVILAVLALVSGSAGVYVGLRSHWFASGGRQATAAPSGVGLAGSTTAASDGSSAPSGAELAQLRRVAPLIQRSAQARVAVAAAVQKAGRCRLKPARAIGVLRHAIAERRAAIGRARRLATTAIANGPALISYLVQALRQSSAADRAFGGWLRDMASRHSCPVNTSRNHSYQAALLASGHATAAKENFLRLWNPLARQFSQPAFTAGGI